MEINGYTVDGITNDDADLFLRRISLYYEDNNNEEITIENEYCEVQALYDSDQNKNNDLCYDNEAYVVEDEEDIGSIEEDNFNSLTALTPSIDKSSKDSQTEKLVTVIKEWKKSLKKNKKEAFWSAVSFLGFMITLRTVLIFF